MAEQKFSKGSDEWFMFTTFWAMCQAHWIPDKTEGYWQSVIDDCKKFNETFKDVGFSKQLALALIDFLEEKSKT